MANFGRKIGANIYEFMIQKGIQPVDFAEELQYSIQDVWNMIEGKIVVPPVEMNRIADFLCVSTSDLLNNETEALLPDLQYMKEFDNPDNLDVILDLMDEYVELRNAI